MMALEESLNHERLTADCGVVGLLVHVHKTYDFAVTC